MKWVSTKDSLPEHGTKVMVFSPVYPENDDMRFRIMDGQFVRICTEGTDWTYLEGPENTK